MTNFSTSGMMITTRRPFSKACAFVRLRACCSAAKPALEGAGTVACAELPAPPCMICAWSTERLFAPKSLSASRPLRGVLTAPSASTIPLSKAYTDVLIASGTTCSQKIFLKASASLDASNAGIVCIVPMGTFHLEQREKAAHGSKAASQSAQTVRLSRASFTSCIES